MLQRAASNAYSWWWASHIRTKHSKWLEQSLQDMEEKVTAVLKLIEEDGDSFAKRAEMYYKKRPELIHFVEESYRAFRALAERYDQMSKELQHANSTLASAFPDQFQHGIDDNEDDNGSQQFPKRPNKHNPNIPNVPKQFPTKKIKAFMALTPKTGNGFPAGNAARSSANKARESGMSKDEAVDEIDKLQKAILTKQTEKEFTKSSYESGVAKYWEIEQEITEMQQRVSKLQDEFGVGKEIEDNEARTLMLGAALKSCQDTLAQLQEKQDRSAVEAREERQKIMDARDKLLSFKGEPLGFNDSEQPSEIMSEGEALGINDSEQFEVDSCLSVSEMADKIDELVGKVINLESAVSSQTAVIQRLRAETDELQQQIQELEHDKASLIDGKNTLNDKIKEMEDKLKQLQELEQSVHTRNTNLQMQFTHVSLNLDQISHNLPTVKHDQENEHKEAEQSVIAEESPKKDDAYEEAQAAQDASQSIPQAEQSVITTVTPKESPKKDDDAYEEAQGGKELQMQQKIINLDQISHKLPTVKLDQESQPKEAQQSVIEESPKKDDDAYEEGQGGKELQEPVTAEQLTDWSVSVIQQQASSTKDQPISYAIQQEVADSGKDQQDVSTNSAQTTQPEDEPNWQQMFISGLEGKEKVILNEYTSILRNYKDVKKRLGDVENKSENSLMELRELETQNANKDEEIHSLRHKLILLQQKLEDCNNKKMKESKEDNNTQVPSFENDDDIINFIVEEPRTMSPVEEKLRADIDEILEENLDFWMRFSSSFSHVQKLQSEIEDLQKELAKIESENKKKKDGSSTPDPTLKSDARPIYKHLKQIQTELAVWLEKSTELKDELTCRFSQLCRILEDITRALSDGAVDEEMKFTSFQAAKFQGEVLNMQQENNKVEDELQAAVEHVTNLQTEVERTINRLNEELGISGSKSSSQMREGGSRNRIPLGAFIFGSKTKKHKQSILSSMHPSWHKKH